jgi:hypothetical protein
MALLRALRHASNAGRTRGACEVACRRQDKAQHMLAAALWRHNSPQVPPPNRTPPPPHPRHPARVTILPPRRAPRPVCDLLLERLGRAEAEVERLVEASGGRVQGARLGPPCRVPRR